MYLRLIRRARGDVVGNGTEKKMENQMESWFLWWCIRKIQVNYQDVFETYLKYPIREL